MPKSKPSFSAKQKEAIKQFDDFEGEVEFTVPRTGEKDRVGMVVKDHDTMKRLIEYMFDNDLPYVQPEHYSMSYTVEGEDEDG